MFTQLLFAFVKAKDSFHFTSFESLNPIGIPNTKRNNRNIFNKESVLLHQLFTYINYLIFAYHFLPTPSCAIETLSIDIKRNIKYKWNVEIEC